MQLEIVDYLRSHPAGVVATVGQDGTPQAAFVAIAATTDGELVFDAKRGSRKIANLRFNSRIAIVVGGTDDTTLQCEGIADIPDGAEREHAARAYLAAFPQFAASLRDSEIVVVRVRPTWVRFGDYRTDPPCIAEAVLSGPFDRQPGQ